MAAVLHLLKGADAALACAAIERQLGAGDRVTVALLPGAGGADLPPRVAVHRVPADLSYSQLLDLIFKSDQVITW
ncbi:MAG: hypothetical protein AAB418_00345 [candidate division NC10 bacterium]|jgi:hypothetical protein